MKQSTNAEVLNTYSLGCPTPVGLRAEMKEVKLTAGHPIFILSELEVENESARRSHPLFLGIKELYPNKLLSIVHFFLAICTHFPNYKQTWLSCITRWKICCK